MSVAPVGEIGAQSRPSTAYLLTLTDGKIDIVFIYIVIIEFYVPVGNCV